MGQLIVVQGRDAEAARRLLEASVAHLSALTGREPDERQRLGPVGLARWSCAHAASLPISTDESGSALAIGGWLLSGARDSAAVGRLGSALRHGPEAWDATAAELDGFFVVATADAAGEQLVVATDRTGSLHLYRADRPDGVVLSTSALALGALVGQGLDRLAALEFLGSGSVFERRSSFVGVSKVPAATVLRLRGGAVAQSSTWWELASCYWGHPASAAARADVPALASSLVAVLEGLLSAWPDAVLDLTGGFDSRGVLAAARATGRDFRTVVVGEDGDGDVVSAARLAAHCGLEHHHLRPGVDFGARTLDELRSALVLTDGEADVVEYAGIRDIHVHMGGLAGAGGLSVNGSSGEFCRGYWWDLLSSRDAPGKDFDAARAARGRFATNDWADRMTAGQGGASSLEHFTGVVERTVAELRELPGTALADHVYLQLRMHRWAGRLVSATSRLWPCVSPFMFEAPMRAALGAPPALRSHSRMARALIEHLDPALAALPMAGGYPALPIRLGTLHRFAPLAAELAGKVWKRVRPGGAPAPRGPSLVAHLWEEADIAEVLRPTSMASAGLYDGAALATFLEASRADGFTERARFGRVVTLELTARALEDSSG